jgi:molecular chaperone HtpG
MGYLNDVVRKVTTVTTYPGTGQPRHFFEVELRGLARHKNDVLLNEHEIEAYLAQVAPVPFHPDFRFGAQIEDYLATFGVGGSYDIFIGTTVTANSELKQILRAYRNTFGLFGGKQDRFSSVEFIELPGVDGSIAAVGWTLDHGYYGAIPRNEGIRGMRLRLGNIQVGSDEIVAEVFPEPRFNSWMVGEIHFISPKLIPNGRRDAFESNSHFLNLQGHVAARARIIAKTCRYKSRTRNFERRFEIGKDKIDEKLSMVSRSSLPRAIKEKLRREISVHVKALDKLVSSIGDGTQRNQFERLLSRIKVRVGRNINEIVLRDPLGRFPKAKQAMYRHVIGLIFESAPRNVAGPLIEKLLTKLSR